MSPIRESHFRGTSIKLLGISILAPIATWWFRERERNEYLLSYGIEPEGAALFGIVALGALVTFILLSMSALYSIRAFRALEHPRSAPRVVESILICSLPIVLASWVFFVVVYLQDDTPQIIRIP